MDFKWEYPLAVLAHGGGYASIVEETDAGPIHSLIVLTDPEAAPEMMARLGILGAPRLLNNAREFRMLVECLQAPVTQVAFDIDPEGSDPNPKAVFRVDELLTEYLVADYSPWNYPIFIVATDVGFASIEAAREDGSGINAISVFRSRQSADDYIEANGDGEACELKDLADAQKFFNAVADQYNAVALDPELEDGSWRTKYCFDIGVLLEKYLVEARGEDSPS